MRGAQFHAQGGVVAGRAGQRIDGAQRAPGTGHMVDQPRGQVAQFAAHLGLLLGGDGVAVGAQHFVHLELGTQGLAGGFLAQHEYFVTFHVDIKHGLVFCPENLLRCHGHQLGAAGDVQRDVLGGMLGQVIHEGVAQRGVVVGVGQLQGFHRQAGAFGLDDRAQGDGGLLHLGAASQNHLARAPGFVKHGQQVGGGLGRDQAEVGVVSGHG